ncbi:MAG: hypothetical protein K0R94_969 [Burkholderiales bacterium]|jgi:hypothetical protein|nr:hypothetical protein [Burkholderiales bacterium]
MFKKIIFFILVSLYVDVYAQSLIGIDNVVQPIPQNSIGSPPATKNTLDLKYAAFDYQMNPTEFSNLLEQYSLSKSLPLNSSKNIVLLARVNTKEFNILQQKLSKEFSTKYTGSSRCAVTNGLCGGGGSTQLSNTSDSKIVKVMSIQFKTDTANKDISVRVISDKTTSDLPKLPGIASLHSEALLTAVKNKNYVLISQVSVHGILYGQIILVSFDNPNTRVSTF